MNSCMFLGCWDDNMQYICVFLKREVNSFSLLIWAEMADIFSLHSMVSDSRLGVQDRPTPQKCFKCGSHLD